MKTIVFGSQKGGVGKSTLTALMVRILSTQGKVLVIDFESSNSSTSSTFIPSKVQYILSPLYKGDLELRKEMERKNIAQALQGDNLADYVIKTDNENIDIIRSSQNLAMLHPNQNLFKRLINNSNLEQTYSYIICDTSPAYTDTTLMVYEAADILITPVLMSQYCYLPTKFMKDRLPIDTSIFKNWKIVYNQWGQRWEDKQTGTQTEYQQLFERTFTNILNTRIPSTSLVRDCIDRQILLGNSQNHQKLRQSIISLAEEITGEKLNIEGAF